MSSPRQSPNLLSTHRRDGQPKFTYLSGATTVEEGHADNILPRCHRGGTVYALPKEGNAHYYSKGRDGTKIFKGWVFVNLYNHKRQSPVACPCCAEEGRTLMLSQASLSKHKAKFHPTISRSKKKSSLTPTSTTFYPTKTCCLEDDDESPSCDHQYLCWEGIEACLNTYTKADLIKEVLARMKMGGTNPESADFRHPTVLPAPNSYVIPQELQRTVAINKKQKLVQLLEKYRQNRAEKTREHKKLIMTAIDAEDGGVSYNKAHREYTDFLQQEEHLKKLLDDATAEINSKTDTADATVEISTKRTADATVEIIRLEATAEDEVSHKSRSYLTALVIGGDIS
jgi:hypothetical protein